LYRYTAAGGMPLIIVPAGYGSKVGLHKLRTQLNP
jgi:hypothetical protein